MALLCWRDLAAQIAALAEPVAGVETVTLRRAAGRVLAADGAALQPIPLSAHAVMDGFALGAPPPGDFVLVPAGATRLAPGEAAPIAAGEPVPDGTAAVALADRAQPRDGAIRVAQAQARDNIRRAGEERAMGATILTAGTRLDARHVALAAAAGLRELAVRRRPRVALLALTDGVEPSAHLAVAEALTASPLLAQREGVAVGASGLDGNLRRVCETADLALVVGDSLGDEGGPLAAAMGADARILRAAMKPAKPVILGRIGGAIVLGLSGTAYAVAAAGHLFLRPLLGRLAGLELRDPRLAATLAFARPRTPGRAEALPVRATVENGRLRLAPAGRFGQLSALAAMDGFALIDAEAAALNEGDVCLFHPLLLPLL